MLQVSNMGSTDGGTRVGPVTGALGYDLLDESKIGGVWLGHHSVSNTEAARQATAVSQPWVGTPKMVKDARGTAPRPPTVGTLAQYDASIHALTPPCAVHRTGPRTPRDVWQRVSHAKL